MPTNPSPPIQQRAPNPINQFQASLVQRLPNLRRLPQLPNLPTLPQLPNLPAIPVLTGQASRQAGGVAALTGQAGRQGTSVLTGQAGTQAAALTSQAGTQARVLTGHAGRQAGASQAGGQAGTQAAEVTSQNRKRQQLKEQRQQAKNQSLQLPQVKSVGDYIARRNRMVMGGNTCSHEYRFLTQRLQEVDFIKRLYVQQVPLSISEVCIWKTTRMEVAHNLVTKYESFSDIVVYVVYVIYVVYIYIYYLCHFFYICVVFKKILLHAIYCYFF